MDQWGAHRLLNAFASNNDWLALAAVLPVGIFFGFVHALTPGHGKTVLSSYLLGSRLSPIKSTAVAGTLAFTHITSAVIITSTAAPLITRTLGGIGRAPTLEAVSRGLLAVIGAWILLRAFMGRHEHVHGEGIGVGMIAGLVPCPLTFLMMSLAISRGVPEAGLTFAMAMMMGVGATLCSVALLTVFCRDALLRVIAAHGRSLERFTRLLDGLTGALLLTLGIYTLARGVLPYSLSAVDINR
jgi:nickel/cobalt transporter (NicO) family protein